MIINLIFLISKYKTLTSYILKEKIKYKICKKKK